jgi:hypothetical protein
MISVFKEKYYIDAETGELRIDRRSGIERRNPVKIYHLLSLRQHRRKTIGRRKTDKAAYVDLYDYRAWGIAIAVMLLSGLDASLTSLHIIKGTAKEVNPLMDAIIRNNGLFAFFGVKALLTALPMIIILIHKEWTLGRYAAQLCLFSYILLACYHVYLVCLSWI